MIMRTMMIGMLALGLASADTLTLRSGKVVEGTYLGGDSRQVRMAVGDRVESFSVSDVWTLQFGSSPTAATAPATSTGATSAAPPTRPAPGTSATSSGRILRPDPSYSTASSTSTAKTIELPAGTILVVRMIDDVDSERDRVGQTFRASLDEPVMLNGETVIPRGVDVLAKLVEDKQSGKLSGRTELTLDLVSVTVGGKPVDLNTQEVTTASESRTGQTAKRVGGLAAVGAIVGAIVTGASRGIGRGIAQELSRSHDVIATYKGRRDAAESLQAATGVQIFQCDISSRENRTALIEFARGRLGRLDLLVNNAGISQRQRSDVLDASEESFDELIGTNLKGPHFLTQLAARWMIEQGAGRIVFVTSISSYAASVNRAEYCVSKAGLSMSAALYAQRLAPLGILVFEIRPGIIRTDMIAKVEQTYEERIAGGLLPQHRMGEPFDVARAVRAIADGLLDYCAGQILNVDGGFHLRSL